MVLHAELLLVVLVPLNVVAVQSGDAKFQPSVVIAVYPPKRAMSIEADRLGRREFGISVTILNTIPP